MSFVGVSQSFADFYRTQARIDRTIRLRSNMERMKRIGKWKEFESIALPVVLLFTGLILIGGDRVGVLSLDRVQNLWPLALILVGLSDLLTNSGDTQTSDVDASQLSRNGARRER